MPPDPDALREVLARAARLEREWSGRDPGTSSRYLPWMPFSIPAYIALLAEALPEAPGNRMLEIGPGPGSKMILARELFGLDVTGIEVSRAYAERARHEGLDIITGDAADFRRYGAYDLIWFYRPFRDPDFEAILEKIVWEGMAPGAVVIGAGLEAPPPDWHALLDDWERKRGIWMKPPRPPAA